MENFIYIEHEDGSLGRYGHLTSQGVLFEVGDSVNQGDTIALSGDSGASTAPHLHFDVLNSACLPGEPFVCRTTPITFRNTSPHPNGLIENISYRAL